MGARGHRGAHTRRAAAFQLRSSGVTLGGEGFGWRRSELTDDFGRRIREDIDDEAKTAERIVVLRAEGRSIPEIVAALEAEGRSTRRGGRWHPTTVQRILRRFSS